MTLAITFLALPIVNDYISVTYANEPIGYTGTSEHFKVMRTTTGEATIGVNIQDQVDLYFDALTLDFSDKFFITKNATTVFLKQKNNQDIFYWNSSTGFVTFEVLAHDNIIHVVNLNPRKFKNNPHNRKLLTEDNLYITTEDGFKIIT